MGRFDKCGLEDCMGWACEYHGLPSYVQALLRVARAVKDGNYIKIMEALEEIPTWVFEEDEE